MRIDLHHHHDDLWIRVLTDRLDRVETHLLGLRAQGEVLMSGSEELNAKYDRMVASAAKIAADIRILTAGIGVGMTQAEVDAANARAEEIASGLEALDQQTPDAG